MVQEREIELYLKRADNALQQARDNLDLGHYEVATSRAYYAMLYVPALYWPAKASLGASTLECTRLSPSISSSLA